MTFGLLLLPPQVGEQLLPGDELLAVPHEHFEQPPSGAASPDAPPAAVPPSPADEPAPQPVHLLGAGQGREARRGEPAAGGDEQRAPGSAMRATAATATAQGKSTQPAESAPRVAAANAPVTGRAAKPKGSA
ncbi:MAG TPA: hypothetical protein VFQ44_04930 [Streptosporangiaceae bacterium]|nr:hypothetical protein [Streptosporangiaceae bacterium]